MDDDCFKFVISAKPLFCNLPQPGRTPILALSMDDLKSASMCSQTLIDSHTTECLNRIDCATKPNKNATRGLELEHSRRDNYRYEPLPSRRIPFRPILLKETQKKRTIASMPDPEGIYSSTLGAADVSNSTIEPPNVRDGNGRLIQPDEYDKRLQTGMKVTVNVHMKM